MPSLLQSCVYPLRPYNCLAGFLAHQQNESNCTFTLNFKQVYWNSRLHTEHERLVKLFNPGDVVADVMAGVGPFAVPAAKKGCRVLGNDLNPEGTKWMEVNRVNNKVCPRSLAICHMPCYDPEGADHHRSSRRCG